MRCELCPNRCGVEREKTVGRCGLSNEMRIARIAPHYHEEPIISGQRGSGTVFFSGCAMDCSFCQNHSISKAPFLGRDFSVHDFIAAVKELELGGVHNINLVTPTHFSHKIKEAFSSYRPAVPVVYNTSGFELPEVIRRMHGVVDVYLTDLKYADNQTALRYSGRAGYFDAAYYAIEEMVRAKPLRLECGLLKQGVIIRHLVLPGELENTKQVIRLFKERWAGRAYLSVMSQFFPAYQSVIKRTLKPIEYKIVLYELEKLGIEDCFVQDLSAASAEYVPDFPWAK